MLLHINLFLFSICLAISSSDWVSEWMSPVQDQLNENSARNNNLDQRILNDEIIRMAHMEDSSEHVGPVQKSDTMFRTNTNQMSTSRLKIKLENTLKNAQSLADTLKSQINALTAKEKLLKEAISNGRAGVSTVTVSQAGHVSRSYIIRDGYWTLCNGVIQFPNVRKSNLFEDIIFASPRCIGQEMTSKPDPCVFHSMIKYETLPLRRKLEYYEDDYLCLKPSFNNTLEQYLSVPIQLVNETCSNGIIRSLADNIQECGIRTMAEYTYYPQTGYSSSTLPLEYCDEKDGSCKLIVAWHVSNSTIENFEFLKNEPNFKRYFIKSGGYIEQVI